MKGGDVRGWGERKSEGPKAEAKVRVRKRLQWLEQIHQWEWGGR